MTSNRLLTVALAITCWAASGCATQRIVSQWSNPAYANPVRSFAKVMVVGVMEQDAIRRNFEDYFVGELRAAGINAVPGYQTIPATKNFDPSLKGTLKDAGADGALVTRLVRLEQHTEVGPEYPGFYPSFGFYRWNYPGWYGGVYLPPAVYQYPVLYSETTLYDLPNDEVVWTATIRTIDLENANETIKEYVDTIIGAVKAKIVSAAIPR